jgi:hypothetical protein
MVDIHTSLSPFLVVQISPLLSDNYLKKISLVVYDINVGGFYFAIVVVPDIASHSDVDLLAFFI